MALIAWTFFKTASGWLLSMLSYKYFKEPPGIDCNIAMHQYSDTIQAMAFSEAKTLNFESEFEMVIPLNKMSR